MRTQLTGRDEILVGSEHGRICALAAAGQRDLQGRAAAHHELFAAKTFDPALFSAVAHATAFGAPWCTVEQLQLANWASLWVFAADWRMDWAETSAEEVAAIVADCLAVADGVAATAASPLGRFLAEIRDRLATAPSFPAGRLLWRDEVERMLSAMARERQWRPALAGGAPGPTFDEYLDNADNTGLSFVNVTHWLFTGDRACLDRLDELIEAGREAQRVLRLVNDLATHQRDEASGDLNALMWADRGDVSGRIAALVDRCQDLLHPLEASCPQQVVYLARQIGFTSGFYRVTDFWGDA
ncbi:terpene synthase family protein [Dactylosporangium sp. NPDC051485]|uniref:terpene synthase family protein n=1 Tax=Dactylosporangium sp. NPDC051485 TaxID=3154846 RepID=UPI00341F024C